MRDHPDAAATAARALWVLPPGVIAVYAFLAALGAFAPGDVLAVTIAVGVLTVLWLLHGRSGSRERGARRDPRRLQHHERRGV